MTQIHILVFGHKFRFQKDTCLLCGTYKVSDRDEYYTGVSCILVIAKVCLKNGNKEYRQGQSYNAIQFYTEGIQANCKDIPLNAKLYSNRATVHFHLGKEFLVRFIVLITVSLEKRW